MSNHIRIDYEKQYEQHIVLVCFCFGMFLFCFGMYMFWYVYVIRFLQISTSAREGSAHRDVWTPLDPTTVPASLDTLWAPTRPLVQVYITFNINFYPFVSSEFFHPFFFNRQSLFHWKTVYLLVKWGSHFLYVQHMFSIGKLCKT